MLQLAGWRLDDVITGDDIPGLVKRALNFAPGQAQLSSNTSYTLLGLVGLAC